MVVCGLIYFGIDAASIAHRRQELQRKKRFSADNNISLRSEDDILISADRSSRRLESCRARYRKLCDVPICLGAALDLHARRIACECAKPTNDTEGESTV